MRFVRGHHALMRGFSAAFFVALVGYASWSLQIVEMSRVFGSDAMAGYVLAGLMAVQVFLMNPLAGIFADKVGAPMVCRFAIMLDLLGAVAWLASGGGWGEVVFFAAYQFKQSFFVMSALILQMGKKKEGGVLFGIDGEVRAIGGLLAVLATPLFILHTGYFPVWAVGFDVVALALLWKIPTPKHIVAVGEVTEGEELAAERSPLGLNTKALLDALNPFAAVRGAVRYVRANHKYPLFALGTSIFTGTFYGAVWFLFPLFIAESLGAGGGGENSMQLGIYEVVTILCAVGAGALADRIDWRRIEKYAWIAMIVLIWMMVAWHSPFALIGIGFFIGMADNFFYAAATHVLAHYNKDKKDSGQFSAISATISDLGYMVAPVATGYLYHAFGFSAALAFVAAVVTGTGVWMLLLLWRVKVDAGMGVRNAGRVKRRRV